MAERQRKGADVEQPPTPDVAEPQRRPPAAPPTEEQQAAVTSAGPLGEDDSGRTKMPRDYLLSRSERFLGIPQHELIGALVATGNDDEELTLNAARKAHEKFMGSATTVEEEE